MTLEKPDIKELKALVEWMNTASDVRELSVKYGDVELFVSRNENSGHGSAPDAQAAAPSAPAASSTANQAPPAAAPTEDAGPASAPPAPASTERGADEVTVTAPMVGTFYEAPSPGAEPFVKVGDRVSADSVLCILEVMKLMNNVEAGVEGVVSEILVENNQAVEFGQPLVVITRDS